MSDVESNVLLPANVDPGTALDELADPGQYVIVACERAKTWLAHALEHGDIEQIVELKSQAEAIRVYTAQKELGHDAELSAAEIVRRAERGLGLAVRQGQATGTVRSQADNHRPGHDNRYRDEDDTLMSSRDIFGGNGWERRDAFVMADDASDEDFEEVIAEAKAEGNLSRANVVRKVRGETPKTTADRNELLRGHRRPDANRIVREAVYSLEGIVITLNLVEPDRIDPAEAGHWADSLSNSIKSLNRLVRQLKESTQ